MRMFVGLLAAVMTAAPAMEALAAGTPVAAVLTRVRGKVEVKAYGASEWKKAKRNMVLHEGDALKTGKRAGAAVVFQEGVETRINEESEFEIRTQKGLRGQVRQTKMKVGQVWTRMLSGKGGGRFQVRTPKAVASVRGTEADISMRKLMTVKVYEGIVDLQNAKGSQSLTAGRFSTVSGGRGPTAPRTLSKDAYEDWQNGLKSKNYEKSLQGLRDAANPSEKTLNLKVRDGDKTHDLNLKFKRKK